MNRFRPPSKPQGRPKPKSFKEMPKYWKDLFVDFFTHLFYIIRLVFEASPGLLIIMVVCCILSGVLPVVGAYLSAGILNEVAALLGLGATMESIWDNLFFPLFAVLLAYFIYMLIQKLCARVSHIVHSLAGELVVNHIRMKIMQKAKTVDLASFDRPSFYEKLENANREAGMRPLSILSATNSLISTLISAVTFVVILAGLHPLAPVVIAVMAIPGAFVNYHFRNRNFWYMRFRSKERRQMNYFSGLLVDKDLAKEVRLMGTADHFIDRYQDAFGRYYSGVKRLVLKEGLCQSLVALLSLVVNLALFSYSAYWVVHTGSAIGDYSLYTGALTSITAAVSTMVSSTATIYEGTLFIDNLITFMKEPVTVVPKEGEPVKPRRNGPHTLEFRDVSFRYPGMERDVLSHIDLRLENGESVVLVGLNGAGKTTLIKLLTRLYDPTEGCILLDGVDLREYDVRALYDIFGIIFQDFGKYAMTVEENIALAECGEKPDREAVRLAAKQGNADGFIEKLPQGYDTPLMRHFEENGTELSGGQWQKLSVARAFYKNSDILILDEPTSALDALAEQEVYKEFAELSRDKISVFVSHRLSSATMADKIVVIDGGNIAEVGSHVELMQKKGIYHMLFTTQASRYLEENWDELKKKGASALETTEKDGDQ